MMINIGMPVDKSRDIKYSFNVMNFISWFCFWHQAYVYIYSEQYIN